MRRISRLEEEYRQLKRQEAPELWSRIEGNLKEYPERERGREGEGQEERRNVRRPYGGRVAVSGRTVFAVSAAAAALLVLVISGPWHYGLRTAGNKADTAGGPAEDFFPGIIAAETTASAERNEAAADGTGVGTTTGTSNGTAAGTVGWADEERRPEEVESQAAGVLYTSQLNLGDYQSLSLPAEAVTAAEDSMYFSEQLLEDTELLCAGTVTDVSLEADTSGSISLLVYEIRVDSVCYSSGYTTGLARIQVRSPIVSAVGGESQILYQLQEGSSYVLPLKASGESWELIFPFAPQIQAVPGGGYVFHSGFMSLTNSETWVVVGQQEGANDFYYDRMLFRDDDNFLSELISLVVDQA